jgi:hypothetical protein
LYWCCAVAEQGRREGRDGRSARAMAHQPVHHGNRRVWKGRRTRQRVGTWAAETRSRVIQVCRIYHPIQVGPMALPIKRNKVLPAAGVPATDLVALMRGFHAQDVPRWSDGKASGSVSVCVRVHRTADTTTHLYHYCGVGGSPTGFGKELRVEVMRAGIPLGAMMVCCIRAASWPLGTSPSLELRTSMRFEDDR